LSPAKTNLKSKDVFSYQNKRRTPCFKTLGNFFGGCMIEQAITLACEYHYMLEI